MLDLVLGAKLVGEFLQMLSFLGFGPGENLPDVGVEVRAMDGCLGFLFGEVADEKGLG